jgi:hypothetical protein
MRGAPERATESPETEIVLCCARVTLDPPARDRLAALLAGPVDWPGLLRIAVHHGVLPLVCRHLEPGVVGPVPRAVRDVLRERFRSNLVRNVMLAQELARLVNLLEARGIAALPYKGPLLALAAYGDLGLRSFSDLDIVVERRHVLETARLLGEQGYRDSRILTRAQAAAFLDTQYAQTFTRADQSAWVEVHWALTARSFCLSITPAELIARARWTTLAGAPCRTLSPEDLGLVLCVHGVKHCWERIEWVVGLAELVRRPGALDWGVLARRAAERGGSRILHTALALAHQLLGIAPPDALRPRVEADAPALELAREASARLRTGSEASLSRGPEIRFHLRARERARDRARYVWRFATTQSVDDWAALPLPAGLGWAYRVVRPLRLTAKLGRVAVRRSLAEIGRLR